jgi:hypothetical protein
MQKTIGGRGGEQLGRRKFFGALSLVLAGVGLFRPRAAVRVVNHQSTDTRANPLHPHPDAVPRTNTRTGSHG